MSNNSPSFGPLKVSDNTGDSWFQRIGGVAMLSNDGGQTFSALGGGAASQPSTLILDDAGTTTTPNLLVLRHTSTGTAAVNFGATFAVELESGGGNTRQVMTDITQLSTATDGAEAATRTISLMSAGVAATPVLAMISNSAGSLSIGTLTLTDSGSFCGLLLKAAGAGVLAGFRVRNGAPGFEYLSTFGHTFYGDMAASAKLFVCGPTASGIAFFGVTQVTQQNATGTATGFTAGGGTTVTDQSTFTGASGATAYRISDVVRALKNYGLLAV